MWCECDVKRCDAKWTHENVTWNTSHFCYCARFSGVRNPGACTPINCYTSCLSIESISYPLSLTEPFKLPPFLWLSEKISPLFLWIHWHPWNSDFVIHSKLNTEFCAALHLSVDKMREYTINTPESELNGTKDHYCFKIKYIYITDCRYGYVAAALFVFTAKTNNKKAKT